MKNVLITGVAGFIGSRTAELLLNNNSCVIGIDNLNDYYDVRIKRYRLNNLNKNKNFSFYKTDIENLNEVKSIFQNNKIDAVINLAARAGVRFSLENPFIYSSTNYT